MSCEHLQDYVENKLDMWRDEIYTEYGHNAEPVNDGRCCDMCNQTVVIPRRIKDAQSNKR